MSAPKRTNLDAGEAVDFIRYLTRYKASDAVFIDLAKKFGLPPASVYLRNFKAQRSPILYSKEFPGRFTYQDITDKINTWVNTDNNVENEEVKIAISNVQSEPYRLRSHIAEKLKGSPFNPKLRSEYKFDKEYDMEFQQEMTLLIKNEIITEDDITGSKKYLPTNDGFPAYFILTQDDFNVWYEEYKIHKRKKAHQEVGVDPRKNPPQKRKAITTVEEIKSVTTNKPVVKTIEIKSDLSQAEANRIKNIYKQPENTEVTSAYTPPQLDRFKHCSGCSSGERKFSDFIRNNMINDTCNRCAERSKINKQKARGRKLRTCFQCNEEKNLTDENFPRLYNNSINSKFDKICKVCDIDKKQINIFNKQIDNKFSDLRKKLNLIIQLKINNNEIFARVLDQLTQIIDRL